MLRLKLSSHGISPFSMPTCSQNAGLLCTSSFGRKIEMGHCSQDTKLSHLPWSNHKRFRIRNIMYRAGIFITMIQSVGCTQSIVVLCKCREHEQNAAVCRKHENRLSCYPAVVLEDQSINLDGCTPTTFPLDVLALLMSHTLFTASLFVDRYTSSSSH